PSASLPDSLQARVDRFDRDSVQCRTGLNPRTQFRQGDILELTDSLSRDPKLLTHFFESLRFATVESEALEDYFALPVIKNLKQVAQLVAQVLVSEQLERRLRIFIPNDLTKFS